ncbi:hypothetical protein P3J6_120162 [Pseudoalteromonas sp. 3J6]|nr:hypothetical protein P3J6_120162 [Pseudoalteromonas sp. 3J6]
MVGVGGSNPLSRTNLHIYKKEKALPTLNHPLQGRWFESTQSYQSPYL